MKPIAVFFSVVLLMVAVAGSSIAADENPEEAVLAQTYEHLARSLIELREAENGLVATILTNHHMMAVHYFARATAGQDVAKNLEAAAGEITKVATEGGKAVQAVRQALTEAGHHHHHHHHSDAESEADYVFVDPDEKKALLDHAGAVARLGASATAEQIAEARSTLDALVEAALAPEE